MPSASIKEINPDEVKAKLNEFCFVDVRNPDEWSGNLGHIKDSIKIPLSELGGRFSEIPKDRSLVMVCRSGARSGRATEFLQEQGFNNVMNLRGGMMAWNALGLPVVK